MGRKSLALLLVATLSVAFFQGCLTLVVKRTQAVAVTAHPAGARVFVDGKYEGDAPLGLRLARKPPHVIRIELDGYRPVEIRLEQKKTSLFVITLPNLVWATPILLVTFLHDMASELNPDWFPVGSILALAAVTGGIVADARSTKSTVLVPRHVNVILEPDAGGGGEPLIIEMDAAELRNITWISVLAADRN